MLSNVGAVKYWHFAHSLAMHCATFELKCLCYCIVTTLSFPTIPNLLYILEIWKKYKQNCKVWTFKLAKIWTFFHFFQFFCHKSDKSHPFITIYATLERYFNALCNKRRKIFIKFSFGMVRHHWMDWKVQKNITWYFATELHYACIFFSRIVNLINI